MALMHVQTAFKCQSTGTSRGAWSETANILGSPRLRQPACTQPGVCHAVPLSIVSSSALRCPLEVDSAHSSSAEGEPASWHCRLSIFRHK